jgi:hypothetical protein
MSIRDIYVPVKAQGLSARKMVDLLAFQEASFTLLAVAHRRIIIRHHYDHR